MAIVSAQMNKTNFSKRSYLEMFYIIVHVVMIFYMIMLLSSLQLLKKCSADEAE